MTTRLAHEDLHALADVSPRFAPVLDPLDAPLFDIHPRAYALLGGAGLWFLGMMALGFAHGPTMPIVLVICAVTIVGYGLIPILFARMWPGGIRSATWRAFVERGIDTGSGHLSGGAALAQMLVLPGLMAGWATFALLLKLAL